MSDIFLTVLFFSLFFFTMGFFIVDILYGDKDHGESWGKWENEK